MADVKPQTPTQRPASDRADLKLRDRQPVRVKFTHAIQFGPTLVAESVAIGHHGCTSVEEDNRGVTVALKAGVFSVPWAQVDCVTRGE